MIKFNANFINDFLNVISQTNNSYLQLDRALPMIYKPAIWNSHYQGAYYLYSTNLVRI